MLLGAYCREVACCLKQTLLPQSIVKYDKFWHYNYSYSKEMARATNRRKDHIYLTAFRITFSPV